MERNNPQSSEGFGVASGLKTAAVIFILGTVAIVMDHAFFIAPYRAAPAAGDVTPAAVAQMHKGQIRNSQLGDARTDTPAANYESDR
jgi:hypothetical protein